MLSGERRCGSFNIERDISWRCEQPSPQTAGEALGLIRVPHRPRVLGRRQRRRPKVIERRWNQTAAIANSPWSRGQQREMKATFEGRNSPGYLVLPTAAISSERPNRPIG